MKNWFKYIHSNYSYNSKILSIGRILIALIILIDIVFRYQNLEAHYSNAGVLPVWIIKQYYPFYQYYLSLHNYFNSLTAQKTLFIIHFIFALCLLLGYKTQLITILNFIFLLSLHRRNPLILQGGDDLLRITLFYMIFLPWGKFYSLDNYLKAKKYQHTDNNFTGFSWIYVLFLINVGFVYLFSALLKSADEWRITGDAIYYALSLDTLRTPIGEVLYPHYLLLKIMTYIVYYFFEILVPLLLIFSPTLFIRNISACFIIFLHIFILINLKVGIFPFVGITTAIMTLFPSKNIITMSSFQSKLNTKEFIFSILLFILILRYSLATLDLPYFSITLLEDKLINSIGLAQRWNMFSPGVKRYDGYLVLIGMTANNTAWDLIHNSPQIHYEKTQQNFNYLKGDRWRKFLENYEQVKYNFVKTYFCYYLIKQWNQQHPENPIEALNILFIKKTTLPDYRYKTETENLCLCNPKIDNYTYESE